MIKLVRNTSPVYRIKSLTKRYIFKSFAKNKINKNDIVVYRY